MHHTDPTAVIELSSHATGGEVPIEVADEGSGIAAEALERIFGRFARADVARSRGDATARPTAAWAWGSRSSTRSREPTAVAAR